MLHQSQKSVARYNEERLAGVGGREYGGEKAITERMRAKQMVDLSSWVVANQREQGSVRTLQVHREREREGERERERSIRSYWPSAATYGIQNKQSNSVHA